MNKNYNDLFEEALAELHSEGKLSIIEDIVYIKGEVSPPIKPPQKPPKKLPPAPVDNQEIPQELIEILISETNAIALGKFIGLSNERINEILFKKTSFSVQFLDGSYARVSVNHEVTIDTKHFKSFVNHYQSNSKPEDYWKFLHDIIHEFLHLFSWIDNITKESIFIEESLTPLVEHEFIFANSGGFNPHLLDVDESAVMRYYRKTAGENRLAYPAEVFYVYDQLLGFSTIYPQEFKKLFRDYYTSGKSIENRISQIEAYTKSLNYPIEINSPQL